MKLKLPIIFILLIVPFSAGAQDVIYWSGSSVNGNWDWGSGCTSNAGGNWYWNTSGVGNRSRPDCYASFNKIYFDNGANTTMNLNSLFDFSSNQIAFIGGTPNRVINTNAARSIYFQNNNGNCKIENYVVGTTHTFNVAVFVISGANNMEINPVNGFLDFTNTITNNSNNAVNIYGFQQVTFSGDISGAPGMTINNTATVVYSGSSKTYSGTTTINTGSKLKISSNQTLGAITLNGGTLQVDAGVTLTITGTYSSTGGAIDNKGTIKFAGASVIFPGNATVNNGVANTLASIEAASSGTLTLNTILNVTGTIVVSSGTLKLGGSNLHLNNATLNIATGATFDNDGENQIINGGNGAILISGTFITRDAQGFVGTNSAIPNIIPTLNSLSTIEYGLNGNQAVQGLTAPTYSNVTFSGSGTKTLISANTVSGTITVKDSATLDVDNNSFGGTGTKLTMTGTAEFKTAGTGVKPDAGGTYTLGVGTKITFTNTAGTLESIRLAPTYYNIDIAGSGVGTNTSTGAIDFQLGGKLTVKSTGIFKLSNTAGFTGASNTSISNVNNPTITLEIGSTIEYSGADQFITLAPVTTAYYNLAVSGTGTKTIPATGLFLGNDLLVKASFLKIESTKTLTASNNLTVNAGAKLEVEDKAALVMINNLGTVTNNGTTNILRKTTNFEPYDYTYCSTPIVSTDIKTTFIAPSWRTDNAYEFLPANYLDANNDGFDDNHDDWSFVAGMTPAKGYIIMVPERPAPFPPYTSATVVFSGKVNNGVVTTPIYFTPAVVPAVADDDFNLVGNPYPSAISADLFINANISTNATAFNTIEGTLYFWTHKKDLSLSNPGPDVMNYSQDDYAVYTLSGGTGTSGTVLGATEDSTNRPLGYIASGQGFFVEAVNAGTLMFNNAMRIGLPTTANSQFYKSRPTKSKITTKDRIWLNLENSLGMFSQQLVGYFDNTTLGFDNGYDGLLSDAGNYINFYSFIDNDTYKIQGRPTFDENDQVRLGYSSAIEGTFKIDIDSKEGVFSNPITPVYLEDKLLNVIYNLKQSSYAFTTEKGTFNDRFVLRYTNTKTLETTDLETLENQVLVFTKNKLIQVNTSIETIAKVFVYDLLGRQIFKKEKVNSNELRLTNFISSQQTLLVKVTLQNGQTITKKIIY